MAMASSPPLLLRQVENRGYSCGLQQAMLVLQSFGETIFGEMLTAEE